ncbi:hypothetical protein K8I31_01930, partial [bacterium]|nr:hypothetical protein [bacterium]
MQISSFIQTNLFVAVAAALSAITPAVQAQSSFPAFEIHTIAHQGSKLGQTSIADIDRDGDLDWITGQADHAGSMIWWWEYQGPDQWIQHPIGKGHTDVGG